LKVEAQGAELDVLLGLWDDNWRRVEQVAVGVHDFDNRLQVVKALLHYHGFQCVVTHGGDLDNGKNGRNYHCVYARRL